MRVTANEKKRSNDRPEDENVTSHRRRHLFGRTVQRSTGAGNGRRLDLAPWKESTKKNTQKQRDTCSMRRYGASNAEKKQLKKKGKEKRREERPRPVDWARKRLGVLNFSNFFFDVSLQKKNNWKWLRTCSRRWSKDAHKNPVTSRKENSNKRQGRVWWIEGISIVFSLKEFHWKNSPQLCQTDREIDDNKGNVVMTKYHEIQPIKVWSMAIVTMKVDYKPRYN